MAVANSSILLRGNKYNRKKVSNPEILYYKTLRIRNLRQMARFRSKLVLFILSDTNTRAWTNTLSYY